VDKHEKENGMRNRACISGTGLYVPGEPIPNAVFNERYGLDVDSFLREQRNIHQRYYMAPEQATSDLILPAAEQALRAAGVEAMDLSLIIVATDTPDYLSPSTAAVVQHRLGARNAGVFDLNTACAGFVTALDVASKFIATDERYRHVLVVGAYGMSKFLDFEDYKIATLFADGAGAVLLSASEGACGVLASELWADGQWHDAMGIYGGGTRIPATHASVDAKDTLLRFARKIPPETNPDNWPRLVRSVLARCDYSPYDVQRYFFTQININSIMQTMDLLDAPRERAHLVMDRYAYTGSACIPMALADADAQGLLHDGDVLMLVGSGGGISMAALALRWGMG